MAQMRQKSVSPSPVNLMQDRLGWKRMVCGNEKSACVYVSLEGDET